MGRVLFVRSGPDARWRVVDDTDLEDVDPGRVDTIGARSASYGEALVEVLTADGAVVSSAGTAHANHVWVEGLEPDTPYRYRLTVDGSPWAEGERWDWGPVPRGGLDLRPGGRSYDLRFRTHPAPETRAPLSFVVLGDYGVGVVSDTESSRRQRRVAEVFDSLVATSDVRLAISVGDNVYAGESARGGAESGGEDDDWYSSFYQPYRYVLARIPFYPTVGNHDTSDTESSDDREQVRDNFYTDVRFTPEVTGSRASVDPGMFYVFRYGADVEFVCIDTSLADSLETTHFFEHPRHEQFLRQALPVREEEPAGGRPGATWRFPFSHHPTYCAGPNHPNTRSMVELLEPMFRKAGVRAVFAGHEHNFQVSRHDGITYFLTGAGGKVREEAPTGFAEAHTVAWAAQAHLLLARVEGTRMTVTPISGVGSDGQLELMTGVSPERTVVEVPFEVDAG